VKRDGGGALRAPLETGGVKCGACGEGPHPRDLVEDVGEHDTGTLGLQPRLVTVQILQEGVGLLHYLFRGNLFLSIQSLRVDERTPSYKQSFLINPVFQTTTTQRDFIFEKNSSKC